MNFENITLSDMSQTQRTNIVWFYLHEVLGTSKFIEKVEQRLSKEREMENYCLTDTEFLFGMMEKF